MEDDCELNKRVTLTYPQRRVWSIPYSINRAIRINGYKVALQYAAKEMAKMRVWGSMFINFHILRLIDNRIPIPKWTKATMRKVFIALGDGARCSEKKDFSLHESVKKFKELYGEKSFFDIRGLNVIVTKVWEEYWTNFAQYHKYCTVKHLAWLIRERRRGTLSKKKSREVAVFTFKALGLDVAPSMESMDECIHETNQKIAGEVYSEIIRTFGMDKIKKWKKELPIELHYSILSELEKYPEGKRFSIAPLCNYTPAFIEVSIDAFKDIHKWCFERKHKKVKDHPLTESQRLEVTMNKPEHISDMLRMDESINCSSSCKTLHTTKMERLGYKVGPTIKTNGVVAYILWETVITKEYTLSQSEYKKKLVKDAEYKAAKQARIEKSMKKNKGVADKRHLRVKAPSIENPWEVYPSNIPFTHKTKGLFGTKSHAVSTIAAGARLTIIDPGHKNIICAANSTWGNEDTTIGFNLTIEQYYHEIGNTRFRNYMNQLKKKGTLLHDALLELSINSLKTSSYKEISKRMEVHVKHNKLLHRVYGSRNHARKKFKMLRLKQSFYDTIVDKIAKDENTIVVVGSAKFATTRVGLSANPIAKIMKKLQEKRRVVLTPEPFTTKRCSNCKDINCDTVSGVSKTLKTNRFGQSYYPHIHGLRHCKTCAQTWNRDYNAARNIYFQFVSMVTKGERQPYLQKHNCGTCTSKKKCVTRPPLKHSTLKTSFNASMTCPI